MIEFVEFPKMSRFSREVIITEKIDGTNASIFIQHKILETEHEFDSNIIATVGDYTIRAGSRTKWITPKTDNAGFANWVLKNAEELVQLGEGHHFGEWWGSGIQRGYGLPKGEKRFSLFNVKRWNKEIFHAEETLPSIVYTVPILSDNPSGITDEDVYGSLELLIRRGSQAAPGFMNPEGIVIYHTAGNVGFKKTILKDESPKSKL